VLLTVKETFLQPAPIIIIIIIINKVLIKVTLNKVIAGALSRRPQLNIFCDTDR